MSRVLCSGAQASLQGAPHGCIMCCRVWREEVGRDSPECMVSTGRGPTEPPSSSSQRGCGGIRGSLGSRAHQTLHVHCWVAAFALASYEVFALVLAFALALAVVARCTARAAAPAAASFTAASRRWVTACHGFKCISHALEQRARCSIVPWRECAPLHHSLDTAEVSAKVAARRARLLRQRAPGGGRCGRGPWQDEWGSEWLGLVGLRKWLRSSKERGAQPTCSHCGKACMNTRRSVVAVVVCLLRSPRAGRGR